MDEASAVGQHIETALGLSVQALEPLGVTAYNRHYALQIDGLKRHLVIYNLPDSLPLAGVRFEHAIIRHLRSAGFAEAPELVVHGGESLFQVGKLCYTLTEWIDGCHDEPDRVINDAQLRASGRTLADFHRATRSFEGKLDYFPEHVFVYTTPHFLDVHAELLEQLRRRVAEADDQRFDAASRAAIEPFSEQAIRFCRSFDRGLFDRVRAADDTAVVHGDYRRLNLVFSPDAVTKVLDYNCCFNDIRLWDVAYSALSFGGKETVGPLRDAAQATRFISAYHEAAPLTADEQRLLPSYLVLVLVKLMTAAFESWWINDRTESLARLLGGEAEAIVAQALG